LSLFWMLICVVLFVNCSSLMQQLVYGGMIQLYVMVFFLAFVKDDVWFVVWMRWMKFAGLLYALSTIVFYFNHALYSRFVMFFFPETSAMLEKFYKFGWMCGICDHFSTNGMVLATAFMAVSLEILMNMKMKASIPASSKRILYCLAFVVLYGLVLSSKRAPLICSFASVGMVYYISLSKRKTNAIVFFCIATVLFFIMYEFLLPYIPGLSTIADKFSSTSADGDVLQGRNVLWAVAYDMISSAPILGHGFGSYAAITEQMHLFTTSAHNYYLQVFAELGAIGLFLYVFVMGLGVKLTLNTIKKMSNCRVPASWVDSFVIRFSLAFQFFVILYNLSASALMYYVILVPYFLSLTAACILSRKYED